MTEVGKETENEELFPEAVFGEKDYLSEVFGLEQHDIRMYSPLTLAYIGMLRMRSSSARFWCGKQICRSTSCTAMRQGL